MSLSARLTASVFLIAPCVLAGCSSSVGSDATEPRPTVIEVAPEDFLGALVCRASGIRTYVATLVEVPNPAIDPPIPAALPPGSSPPTRCDLAVAFGQAAGRGIAPGREYSVIVEGYDRDDLRPKFAVSPEEEPDPDVVTGTRRMVGPDNQDVAPRWTTGEPSTACSVRAEFQQTRRAKPCEPLTLVDPGMAPPSVVELDTAALLGGLSCGTEPGQIERFTVRRDGVALEPVACGETLAIEDALPGDVVSLEVLAFESGSDAPLHGTSCFGKALAGATVAASCDAVSSRGAVRLDVAAVLAAAGAVCDATLSSLVVEVVGVAVPPLRFSASNCSGTARIGDLPPGAYVLSASAQQSSAPAPKLATCSAQVEPGLVAIAACEPAAAP